MNEGAIAQLLRAAQGHLQAGRLDQAERLCTQARAVAPEHFEANHLAGHVACLRGQYPAAIKLLARANKARPGVPKCLLRLGTALHGNGQHEEAAAFVRAALGALPNDAEGWNTLGECLRALGQFADAAAAYQKAIALNPRHLDALEHLGMLLAKTQGEQVGVPYFKRVLEIQPDRPAAWFYLGFAELTLGNFSEATKALDKTLAINPRHTEAKIAKALIRFRTNQMEEAASEFAEIIRHNPDRPEVRSARLYALHYLSGKTRQEIYNEHLSYDRSLQRKAPAGRLAVAAATDRRLRLAFISPDFRVHSVAYFIEPILRHLDRSRFEIILYHTHWSIDGMTERLRSLADHWHHLVGLSYDSVEQKIREDAPDILIDLTGHTADNRLPVFARRVAPVQITYLGYPNTTGIREMDFRFVDPITDPGPEDDKYHTEKLIRFSPCAWAYQPSDSAPEPELFSTAKDRPVVFGSFNNFAKVSEDNVVLWRKLLDAIPNSKLLLKSIGLGKDAIPDTIRRKLERICDDPARLIVNDMIPDKSSHFRLYSQMDVALDTFPYHGTTTTCEALWMGVPVVSLAGDRHVARVGASLLNAVGHPEWIAKSHEDYLRIAGDLAADVENRIRLRATLRDDLRRSLILDHAGQARRFGDALLSCIAMKRDPQVS